MLCDSRSPSIVICIDFTFNCFISRIFCSFNKYPFVVISDVILQPYSSPYWHALCNILFISANFNKGSPPNHEIVMFLFIFALFFINSKILCSALEDKFFISCSWTQYSHLKLHAFVTTTIILSWSVWYFVLFSKNSSSASSSWLSDIKIPFFINFSIHCISSNVYSPLLSSSSNFSNCSCASFL